MRFDLTNTMRTLGGAKYLIRDYTYLIILSSNANLYEFLNSEEKLFICQTIFWNVGTCTFDYEIINFDITHNVLYLSGTSPVLIHELQKRILEMFSLNFFQYLTVSHILNSSKYDSFGSCVYNYF